MDVVELPAGGDLTSAHIRALAAGEVVAIRVSAFVASEAANRTVEWMATAESDDYHVISDRGYGPERQRVGVRRIGQPLSELAGSQDLATAFEDYLHTGRAVEAALTAACRPLDTPIESLLALLGGAWEGGATVARMDGRPLFVGIPRIVEPGAAALEERPHVDSVHPSAFGIEDQISANLYLEVPEAGGELELWPSDRLTMDEVFSRSVADRLRRENLGPSVLLAPKQHDLVVINSRRPHAVRQFSTGRRFSLQCFIGVSEGSSPLLVWS